MAKIIAGNLKMNLLKIKEREIYFKLFRRELAGAKELRDTEIVICPPSVHLESFVNNLGSKLVTIGSQNVFWEEAGSYTGEISSIMVKNLGGGATIIGHSERRRYFLETEAIINAKINAAVAAGLRVIFCIGETREERDDGRMKAVLVRQIKEGLAGIVPKLLENIVIAYEPVWAVGTDVVPTSNEIMEARILIRIILAEKFGRKKAETVSVLYGGSVKAKWAAEVCVEPGMDGVLVGRESLLPGEFFKIAKIINNG